MNYNPIICAIDTKDIEEAKHLITQAKDYIGAVKLGLEFFTYNGPEGVKAISKLGLPIFLDLKFHDIPNTVAGAISSVVNLNIFMLTIHVQGGKQMIKAAVKALSGRDYKPLIVGVSVLTSLEQQDLDLLGVNRSLDLHVEKLAELGVDSGLDGIVCSAHEIAALRAKFSKNIKLIVPGIRPENSNNNDQKRIMTPQQAIEKGADYLVIGRPITQSENPKEAAKDILKSLQI